jgi:hypothetical protein
VETGEQLAALDGHTGVVYCLDWSADSELYELLRLRSCF